MGYDLLAVLLLAALFPLVVLGFIGFWIMTSRDREVVADVWARYAARHELAYEPPVGAWPNRTAPVITWREGNVAYRLEPLGREAHSRTRLTIRPTVKLLGRVVVAPRADVSGPSRASLDDHVFLASYRVTEQPVGLARRILTGPVRRALLGFRQADSVTLGYRRGAAFLEWPGGEVNDARLDEARGVGARIATALEEAFVSVGELSLPQRGQSRNAST